MKTNDTNEKSQNIERFGQLVRELKDALEKQDDKRWIKIKDELNTLFEKIYPPALTDRRAL
jgi:hypothetical protein